MLTMTNLQIQVGVVETIILCIKQRQRALRASYRLLKHKTNNYYMYTVNTDMTEKNRHEIRAVTQP